MCVAERECGIHWWQKDTNKWIWVKDVNTGLQRGGTDGTRDYGTMFPLASG